MRVHKNVTTTMSILHLTTELVNTPTKQSIYVCINLVNSLYKITTECIKLILNIEQFGISSDLIVSTPDVQKYFLLLLLRILINPLRPNSHYSGFVITSQYKNYNFRVLWVMNLE